jgi:hypothetical protein
LSKFEPLVNSERKTVPHIGLDLDNTLIDYDAVFGPVGVELGLLPVDQSAASKAEVREFLQGAGGEADWMRLQGQVYGRYIERARLFEGVPESLACLRAAGVQLTIVSHKTRYGHFDPERIDLWDAARDWLTARGFFDRDGFGFSFDRVVFEETREGKLTRIAECACDVFIDDLPDVLRHPAFPPRTWPLWFAGACPAEAGGGLEPYRNWQELTAAALRALSL